MRSGTAPPPEPSPSADGDSNGSHELRGVPQAGGGPAASLAPIALPCRSCPLLRGWNRLQREMATLAPLLPREEVPLAIPLPPSWGDLTERERRVFWLLVVGKTDREIAVALGWTLNTARGYSAAVRAKLGVRSRRDVRRVI